MMGELVGAYRLTQKLGEGATGETYLGVHKDSSEQAAVKILFPQTCTDPTLVDQFFADIKRVSIVNHTGIADVFDCGVLPNKRAFVIGEYLHGKTLTDALIELGQVTDIASLADIAWQVATMLGAAHDSGVVHGALKPDALFLTFPPGQAPRPLVKLVDFGMARFKLGVRHSQTGSLLGAPLYMSPEAARGVGAMERRADIYSLGCIMFEMICGRPPFVRAGAGELIIAHAKEPPPFASSLEPSVPPAIDQLIGRMLTKNPVTRPQTMAEVALVLERFFKCPTPVAEQPRGRAPVFPLPGPGLPSPAKPPAVAPAPIGPSELPPAAPSVDATAVVPGTSPAPISPAPEPRRTAEATAVLAPVGQAPPLSATALLPSADEGAPDGPEPMLPVQQSWLGKVRQQTLIEPSPKGLAEELSGVRPSPPMREQASRRSAGRLSSSRRAESTPSGAKHPGVFRSINLPIVVISAAVMLVLAAVALLVTRGEAVPADGPKRHTASELVAPARTEPPAVVAPVPPERERPVVGSAGAPPAEADPEPTPAAASADPDDDSAGDRGHPGKDKTRPRRFW